MKQWLETRQVLDRLAELQREGRRAALATVVRVRGSAYRHEGAKMLVAEDGTSVGNVSGGCLEADVREVARIVIETGAIERREYCASADEVSAWDLGVGCEGMVEVFVQPIGYGKLDMGDWTLVVQSLERHVPFAACTDLATGVMRARDVEDGEVSGIRAIDGREVFVDVFTPPPQLVIVSAGDDARHLARFASEVGFRVVVVDHRPGLLTRERFPWDVELVETDADDFAQRISLASEAYAVTMTHNYADDREYVRALLRSPVRYIGMLGPRQRTERIIRELNVIGTVDESRIYGPVGLDIGTDGAEQVALSVIGEILTVRSGRRPASLRERPHPIHAATA
jgi:xanthine/CO dehydrogenase XdhC/CoxF family maturation factor